MAKLGWGLMNGKYSQPILSEKVQYTTEDGQQNEEQPDEYH